MEIPDLTNLPLTAVIATLIFFAAIDTLVAYGVAVMNGNFVAAYALDFLRTHILKVGAPIVLMALIGHGFEAAGIPAIPAAGVAASVSLGIYILTVLASVKDSWDDKAIPPTTTTNISPVVEPDEK
jgi:hypothetical protein